jgi:ketosteroid isomerase-like protein
METNVEIIEEFQKAVVAGDVDQAASFFADDGKYILASGPEPGTTYEGSGIVQIFRELVTRHSDSTVKWSDPVGVDDGRVLVEFTITDQTGKVLHRGVDIFELRDGKIAVKDVFSKAW